MIGLMVIGVIVGYILLAKIIVTKVYEKTQSLKKKYIALAIVVLIPTWDAILGLPIYMYLCKYHAGVKIYQTVDNVEGFYVGEQNKAKESSITLPYKGYNFVDYKDGKDGKYYRNFWLDNNTSERCISYKGAWSPDYTKAFEHGRCIAKEEITESEVSQWEVKSYHIGTTKNMIPILDINRFLEFEINDKNGQNNIAQVVNYSWKGGWIWGLFSSIETGSSHYRTCYKFRLSDEALFLQTTLKPKKGDK